MSRPKLVSPIRGVGARSRYPARRGKSRSGQQLRSHAHHTPPAAGWRRKPCFAVGQRRLPLGRRKPGPQPNEDRGNKRCHTVLYVYVGRAREMPRKEARQGTGRGCPVDDGDCEERCACDAKKDCGDPPFAHSQLTLRLGPCPRGYEFARPGGFPVRAPTRGGKSGGGGGEHRHSPRSPARGHSNDNGSLPVGARRCSQSSSRTRKLADFYG